MNNFVFLSANCDVSSQYFPSKGLALFLLLFLNQIIHVVQAWQNWNYESTTKSTDDWQNIWGKFLSDKDGPSGRKGHTIVLYNESKLILFGGRDNDIERSHIPIKSNDFLSNISSIRVKESSCNNSSSFNSSNSSLLEREECGFIPVGLYYNDVWMYDINCKERYGDLECKDEGWVVLHPGESYGGCQYDTSDGNKECNIPSERFEHQAVMINAYSMLIYGGFSHECEDYCNDVWLFDLKAFTWKEIKYNDTNHDHHPGKRWKFSMIGGEIKQNSNSETSSSSVFIFGGHRSWSNSGLYDSNDTGGYLDDLWKYTIEVGHANNAHNFSYVNDIISNDITSAGKWNKMVKKETCVKTPDVAWSSRNDIKCKIIWPRARASHSAVYDSIRNVLWVFGGYNTYYPYHSDAKRSSTSSQSQIIDTPYPSYPHFLDDLWIYNISSGYWEQIVPISTLNPSKRMDHTMMIYNNDIIILFGGYADNYYYNDTWYYYINENRWLEKTTFVHVHHPSTCTDDIETINKNKYCVQLEPPVKPDKELYPTMKEQPWYTPDPKNNPLYFGIVDNATQFTQKLREKYLNSNKTILDDEGNRIWIQSDVPDGTPIAPFAATGPRQYAQLKQIKYNDTFTIPIWEWCTSVKGQPDRNNDSSFLMMPQLRRKTIGWDGCRDNIRWTYPSSRSGHKSIFTSNYKMGFIYGGIGYTNDVIENSISITNDKTHEIHVLNDFWMISMDNCINNCSNHGLCNYGYCECEEGYYGIDCSNVTCPGSICYYDDKFEQHCNHCCYDDEGQSDLHKDNSNVVDSGSIYKVPCKIRANGTFTGKAQGICDGFGSCQCKSGFLGDDCSIEGCRNNCNSNGYCSYQFPTSRCVCRSGYYGDACQYKECVNNCSYPNGLCNTTSGQCSCDRIKDFNDVTWSTWQGEDCSYLTAWVGAAQTKTKASMLIKCLSFFAAAIAMLF